ncbi:MAG TPA: carbon monoxide dehydrogenase subunit G [Stellaceae bacterium]|nr:carbon monoxide dehydrogenase subunit G [Stellaceae bacterium]
MDMTGEYRVAAPRQKVWDALNDTEILKQCIPGCETITKLSDTEMTATVRAKVGPVSARFGGKVTISDRDPPNGYKITGEGTGGPAGFAKGGATVKLTDDGDGTLLSYVVEANVGGKLAQIGSRLIDATARQMAENFFAKFAAVVGGPAPAAPAPMPTADTSAVEEPPVMIAEMPPAPGASLEMPPAVRTPPPMAPPPATKRLSPAVWVAGLAVAVIVLLYFFTR